MKLIAIINEKGYYKPIIDSDYNSKKDFADALRGNGYKVVCCLSDKDIENIREKSSADLMKYSERTIAFVRECME